MWSQCLPRQTARSAARVICATWREGTHDGRLCSTTYTPATSTWWPGPVPTHSSQITDVASVVSASLSDHGSMQSGAIAAIAV